MTTAPAQSTDNDYEPVDNLAFFRALPIAFGFGLLGWFAIAAVAFGIYKLTH